MSKYTELEQKYEQFVICNPFVQLSFEYIWSAIELNNFISYIDILFIVLRDHSKKDFDDIKKSILKELFNGDYIDQRCEETYEKLKQYFSEQMLMKMSNNDGTNFLLAAAKYKKVKFFIHLVTKIRYNITYFDDNNNFWYSFDVTGKFIKQVYKNDEVKQIIIVNEQNDQIIKRLPKNVSEAQFFERLRKTQTYKDLYTKYKSHILCNEKEFCQLYYDGILLAHQHCIPYTNEGNIVLCILIAYDNKVKKLNSLSTINHTQTIDMFEKHTSNIMSSILSKIELCRLIHQNEKYKKVIINQRSQNGMNLVEASCIYGTFEIVKELLLIYNYTIEYSIELVTTIRPSMVLEMLKDNEVCEKMGSTLKEIIDVVKYNVDIDPKTKEQINDLSSKLFGNNEISQVDNLL